MRYSSILLAALLLACHGTLTVAELYPVDDDDSASVDDDDVVVDDDDVVVDDDDVVVVTECDSGPQDSASASDLMAAADLPASFSNTITTPGSSPDMFAVREGLGVICPLVGSTMGLISTGRVQTIEELVDHDYPGEGPDSSAGDRATVEVSALVPDDANSLRYSLLFLSREIPEWIGTEYIDTFEATIQGQAYSGSIAFDEAGDPISPNATIPLLPPELVGTGFDEDGATGWIQMDVPVAPGDTVSLSFVIFDAADGVWDSAVLLDGFEWRPSSLTEPAATLIWP